MTRAPLLLLVVTLCLLPALIARCEDTPPPAADDSAVIVPGDPPLTEDRLQRFCLFLEWVLDAQFTEAQRTELTAATVESWTTGSAEDRTSVIEMADLQAALHTVTDAERALYRQAMQEQLLGAARANPEDGGLAWLLAVYDAAHVPLAEGPPALTRQMTDAFAELLGFMVAQTTGSEATVLSAEMKDEFAAGVAAQWPEFDADTREQYVGMPLMWAALNAGWPTMAEEDRQKLRDQWREQLIAVLPQPPEQAPAPASPPPADGQVLPLASEDAAGYLARGKQYLDNGVLPSAIADLNQALALDAGSVPALLARGEALRRDGRKDEALRDLVRAAALDPDSADAQKALYDYYYEQSSMEQARRHWDRLQQLQGKAPTDELWSLEIQSRMAANQLRFQAMSNILRMQHETNMTIINNIGGWSTTYRYY